MSGGRRTYVVACLAGQGIGPEVTAAASRALAQVSRQHGFCIEELHPPFDGEALVQAGHPLPAATRTACGSADAVLVAGAAAPALDGVKAHLDLSVRLSRTVSAAGAVSIVSPLPGCGVDLALERAFQAARAAGGRVASVGVTPDWRTRVERHAALHDGVELTHVPLADALAFDVARHGVVVTEESLAAAVEQAELARPDLQVAATAYLAPHGPGLFAPRHGAAYDLAGHGVANPSEMLLAASLLLGEGLGRHAAADALTESLAATLSSTRGTPDLTQAGVGATTREFVDAVLALLPSARRDTDFALGVTR